MDAKLTVDKAGRIVIPKPVRDRLQIGPGDELELESLNDQITLRPLRGAVPLRKKSGVWIFRSGEPLSVSTVDQTIEEVRRERDQQNVGPGR